jgi:hypothetical protein
LSQAAKVRSEYNAAAEALSLAVIDHTDLSLETKKIEELGNGGLDEAGEKQLVVRCDQAHVGCGDRVYACRFHHRICSSGSVLI